MYILTIFVQIVIIYLDAIHCELLLTQVIHRHGSVTPTSSRNTSLPASLRQTGLDQLTDIGRLEAMRLGQILSNRYGSFIDEGNQPIPEKIRARSSDTDRTLKTASLVLQELLGAAHSPYPVHTTSQADDYLLSSAVDCRNYFLEMQKSFGESQIQQKFPNISKLVDNMLHRKAKLLDTILYIRDVVILNDLGYRASQFSISDVKDSIELYKLSMKTLVNNRKLTRLRGGELLKTLLDNMMKKINGTMEQKFLLFSTHDINIAYVMSALELWDGQSPDYTSALLFELHRDQQLPSNYGLRLVYHRRTTFSTDLTAMDNSEGLKLPGCSSNDICDFNVIVEAIRRLDTIPGDVKKECVLHL
ncbi:Uncharacterised protein g9464 [Pycnogonum litorale]